MEGALLGTSDVSGTTHHKFPGKILYAVKTNPNPTVLKTILDSGINNLDVASIKQIQTIKIIIY